MISLAAVRCEEEEVVFEVAEVGIAVVFEGDVEVIEVEYSVGVTEVVEGVAIVAGEN